MKKALLSLSGALAISALTPAETAAQFTVWKDGVSVYALAEGRADYVTFDYSSRRFHSRRCARPICRRSRTGRVRRH